MRAIHHAPTPPASTSVRPALALAAVAVVLALLAGLGVGVHRLLLGRATRAEGGPDEGDAATAAHGASNPENSSEFAARVRDPGATGSVRDAWARAADGARSTPEVPPFVLQFTDPQLARFERTFGDEGTPPPFADATRTGTVARATGVALPPGTACEVRVLPAADGPYNCTLRVRCGDVLLYPDRSQQAGFVACEVEDGQARRANDDAPSARDGDPQVSFDVERGLVTIGDDDPARHVTIALDPGSRPARDAR